jgi:sorting nexin-29
LIYYTDVNEFGIIEHVTSWRIAEVISLFKKGDRRECKNYKGISLLNTEYKMYAIIVNKRLRTISEALLEEEQNGFRTGQSTTDNIFILQQVF